ncbi:UDP-N-acetylglucosamine 1-carboxyvinyltransferase [Bacillus sp. SLBN-46]|uniref:UDP-N-acetylglucosamine 1-carboxyvinyltransferase n=1 Tax=Bacillus sp. SLBN-46 TaxID=3042283 RepID=UPI0028666DDF|nr:UDP-N-acetylglucosamine 1-carboxyvinyltransferase [Bacillus sp. SLBN-46]MDR6125209.1 UDP-N-acetylglucosamine 1-carboxyvinyltransferase [Bacillus sp. SLBN-46]
MEKIIIHGGKALSGCVQVEGAKNAALPIIVAALLAEKGKNIIQNVPSLTDVNVTIEILKSLNADVNFSNNTVEVNAEKKLITTAPFEYVKKMRASFLFMGALLARNGHVKIPYPGGCAIGSRPIDQHLKGFKAMGAKIKEGNDFVEAVVKEKLNGAKIRFDFPSVGATENIMIAATLAEGKTIIENCASEPEINDLANFLNKMGAKVKGGGTSTIEVEGVDYLTGATHSIIPDRIEAGTFMLAAGITKGDVIVKGAIHEHLTSLITKLKEMGIKIIEVEDGLRVVGTEDLKPVDIKTLPYPGFPTDLQAPMMSLLLHAKGTSTITETVFENRFLHVGQFCRMNADILIKGKSAVINGISHLRGAEVEATDLRSAAALILLGLSCEDQTYVSNLNHLDRGYVNFSSKLAALGGEITRTPITNPLTKII